MRARRPAGVAERTVAGEQEAVENEPVRLAWQGRSHGRRSSAMELGLASSAPTATPTSPGSAVP